jgi:hypothetical protein
MGMDYTHREAPKLLWNKHLNDETCISQAFLTCSPMCRVLA